MAKLAICSSLILLLFGCQPGFIDKVRFNEFNEQLYIDAKLNFAIKHPLNWQRIIIPVAAPEYRADTVLWQVEDPNKKSHFIGKMVIQSRPGVSDIDLPDLLSSFMINKAELKSGRVERFDHPAGPALKLLGHDIERGHLTIALKGQRNNFIISLSYPNSHFDKLLPVFQDIVDSFTEIIRPEKKSAAATQ